MTFHNRTLATYTVSDAQRLLLGIDQLHGIIPARSRDALTEALARIVEHAEEIRLRTVEDLIRESAWLIASASGVMRDRLRGFLQPDEASPAHTYRNVLIALVLVTATAASEDPKSVANAVTALKQRVMGCTLRPCADDEILANRAWAWALSHGNAKNRRSAATYALVDAGVIPGETTMIRGRDLVLEPGLEMVDVPGLRNAVTSRVVELGAFNAALLRAHVDNTTIADNDLLTYQPRKPPTGRHAEDYNRAAATTAGILDRIQEAVGLKDPTLTAASIWKWRAEHTMSLEGVSAAAELVGRSTANLQDAVLKDVPRQRSKPKAKKTFSIVA